VLVFMNFIHTTRDQFADPTFKAAGRILLSLLLFSVLFYMFIEDWSVIDSVYFCIIAATSVGFGDVVPVTDLGKAYTIGYVLMSVGLVVTLLGRIAGGMVDRRVQIATRLNEREDDAPPKRRRLRRRSAEAAADDVPSDNTK
jgi:hypothetical protein